MACAGALTSIAMTAAGAFVSNGGLSEVFGDVPLAGGPAASGVAGIPVTTIDAATGEIVSETVTTVATETATIASQSWYTSLQQTVSDIVALPDNLTAAWNQMAYDLGSDAAFAAFDVFGPTTGLVVGDLVEGAVDSALNYGLSWAAGNMGGSIVADVIQGDPSIFATVLATADAYAQGVNQFIGAAENAETYLEATFTNLDNTITGAIAGVTEAIEDFSLDLEKLGNTINWEELEHLGSPGQLVANLDISGNLGPLYDKISNIQVNEQTARQLGATVTTTVLNRLEQNGTVPLTALGLNVDEIARQGANLPANVQSDLYTIFDNLTTDEVAQVKAILGNTQDTVQKGSDLLNPQKLLPEVYETLTTPVRTASVGFRGIYETDGSVNPQLNNLGEDLKGIIPDDLAVANAALGRSLQQVKGISNTSTSALSTNLQNMETLKNLPLLQNQEEYVTDAVIDYWNNYYGTDQTTDIQLATGPASTLKVSDIIGYAAGYNSAAPLQQNRKLFQELQDEGLLDDLYDDSGSPTGTNGIYATIRYLIAGDYTTGAAPTVTITIPPGQYGAGVYTGVSEALALESAWLTGMIPAAQTLMQTLYASDTRFQTITTNANRAQTQLARERLNQQRCDLIDKSNFVGTDQTAINFAQNLQTYALDTSAGGTAEVIERLVNYNSLGGQSTIAVMREARNVDKLASANIQQDTPLSTNVVETDGNLLSGQYTSAEASARVVRS